MMYGAVACAVRGYCEQTVTGRTDIFAREDVPDLSIRLRLSMRTLDSNALPPIARL